MKYRQAALVYLAASALEALTTILILPREQLGGEATYLFVTLGFVALFSLALFNAADWTAGRPLAERTVKLLVFVLGANALVRAVVLGLSLLPVDVSLVISTAEWTRSPMIVTGSGGPAFAVRAGAEACIAYAMGRALWDWPPAPQEAKGAARGKAAGRRSSSHA